MKKENPFDQKTVERALFAAHKGGELQGRKARKFLRQMARYICHAWEIGYRNGLAGTPTIPRDDLPKSDNDPLRRDIFNRTYVAYSSGHRAGLAERGQSA